MNCKHQYFQGHSFNALKMINNWWVDQDVKTTFRIGIYNYSSSHTDQTTWMTTQHFSESFYCDYKTNSPFYTPYHFPCSPKEAISTFLTLRSLLIDIQTLYGCAWRWTGGLFLIQYSSNIQNSHYSVDL